MSRYIEAAFNAAPGELDALCDKLTALGADGLVIEDEADFRAFLEQNHQYWDYVDDELESRYRGISRVKVYVPDDDAGRAKLAAFVEALGLECATAVLDDADWQDNWKQYYKPIEIGDKLLVLPCWESVPEDNKRRVLLLDPGLAFGTGGHATTQLCLRALEKYATTDADVLDLGCGSGILGIAALILGCKSCCGCDIDPKSPDAAADNAKLNGIDSSVYRMYVGDIIKDSRLRAKLGSGYKIVLANIVSDVIIPLSRYVRDFLAPDGVFITGGIIDGREDEVAAALRDAKLEIVEHSSQDGWHSFVCKA